MDVKTTIKVIAAEDLEPGPGVTDGQTIARVIGCAEVPTDRLRVGFASYEAGSLEPLHWHPIEAFYYVLSGHAIVRDIEGNEYHVGPNTGIYAPPGLAGSHEWEVKEGLTLLAIRGTTESVRKMQFTVDKDTKRSYIDVEELARRGGISFSSHYD